MRDTPHTAAEGAGAVPRLPDMPPVDLTSPPPRLTTAWLSSTTTSLVVPIRSVPHP